MHLTKFAKDRHTPESGLSHFEGTDDELEEMVENIILDDMYFDQPIEGSNCRWGYRNGVLVVSVPHERFFTSTVTLQEGDKLVGEFVSRREGEAPRKQFYAVRGERSKEPAKRVNIILYRHDVLIEGNENETDAEWEIVSINARTTEEEEPINPGVLMHNHFGSDGGTATKMTDYEFVAQLKESVEYWRDKAHMEP